MKGLLTFRFPFLSGALLGQQKPSPKLPEAVWVKSALKIVTRIQLK